MRSSYLDLYRNSLFPKESFDFLQSWRDLLLETLCQICCFISSRFLLLRLCRCQVNLLSIYIPRYLASSACGSTSNRLGKLAYRFHVSVRTSRELPCFRLLQFSTCIAKSEFCQDIVEDYLLLRLDQCVMRVQLCR